MLMGAKVCKFGVMPKKLNNFKWTLIALLCSEFKILPTPDELHFDRKPYKIIWRKITFR
jgi:hypothetical protein